MNVHLIKIGLYDPKVPTAELGTRGTYGVEAVDFELGSGEWDGLTLLVSFLPRGAAQGVSVFYTGEPILVPSEIMSVSSWHKMIISGTKGGRIIKSKLVKLFVSSDTMDPCITPDPEPTPDTYQQVVDMMVKQAHDAADAEAAQGAAEDARDETQSLRDEVEGFKDTAVGAAETATLQANRAEGEADKAELSEGEAKIATAAAQQALADLLAILGQPGGFATLDADGKLTSSQIPLISLIKTVKVGSVAEMLALTIFEVQNGDIAQIIVDGITQETYVLVDDQNIGDINSWTVIRTGYAAEAGHATTADNASNADKVNGHRIVSFDSIAELENAVKVSGTLYFAPYDEV